MPDARPELTVTLALRLLSISAALLVTIVSCSGGGGANAATGGGSGIETPSFVDNGDGTVTDNFAGLQWEKKIQRDGVRDETNLHDADNCHPWAGSCGAGGGACRTDADCGAGKTCGVADCQESGGMTAFEWIDALNDAKFAGHADWRMPTARELQTLLDYKRFNPAIDPAFEGGQCGADCADITNPECSCTYWVLQTGSAAYWSSSEYVIPNTLPAAWIVNFAVGFVYEDFKFVDFFVRAVRDVR